MIVNVSMMRDFIKCPQMAYYLHVMRRGPAEKLSSLEVGTLFHEGMDARLRGAAPDKWVLPSFLNISDKGRAEWAKHKLWLPINAWVTPPEWRIVASELPLSAPCGVITIQGRLDAVVEYNGKFWSLQWKTFSGDDLLLLQEKVRLSYHEVIYQWLAEQQGYKPWGGTILGACNKLPGYRIVGGKRQEIEDKEREQALTTHLLFRSPAQQEGMLYDAHSWAKKAHHDLSLAGLCRRNFDMCFGPSGRGRCPFFSVCHEGASVLDEPFVDLEDRYAK